jgi:uncharacterized protein YfbU (UPF0304 family)
MREITRLTDECIAVQNEIGAKLAEADVLKHAIAAHEYQIMNTNDPALAEESRQISAECEQAFYRCQDELDNKIDHLKDLERQIAEEEVKPL